VNSSVYTKIAWFESNFAALSKPKIPQKQKQIGSLLKRLKPSLLVAEYSKTTKAGPKVDDISVVTPKSPEIALIVGQIIKLVGSSAVVCRSPEIIEKSEGKVEDIPVVIPKAPVIARIGGQIVKLQEQEFPSAFVCCTPKTASDSYTKEPRL
jgi:hypothetical protein